MANQISEQQKLAALFQRTNLDSVTEFEKILLKTLERILGKLASFPTDYSRSRYNALLKDVTELIEADYPKLKELIDSDKQTWAALSFEANQAALTTLLPEGTAVAASFATLPEAAVKRVLDPNRLIIGLTAEQHINKLKNNVNLGRVLPIISEGVSTGRPTDEINAEIRAIYGDIARNRVDSLSRTIIQSAMSDANDEAIRQIDKVTDVVDVAYSIAVMDFRTTPVCASLNGMKWTRKKGESFDEFKSRVLNPANNPTGISPKVPRHYGGCRSDLMFTTKEFVDEYETSTRPAVVQDVSTDRKNITKHRDGSTSRKFRVEKVEQVKGKTEYANWFDSQDDKYIKNYLGQTKYKLYKEKNLSIDELWNLQENRIFTVQEIREKFYN